MTFAFYTLGCKVNQYETQALSGQLESAGFSAVSLEESPDFIIVNSCTVTAESNRKTRQAVRRLKNSNPKSCLVLTGCYPQAFPDEMQSFTAADIVLGNTTYADFISHLRRYATHPERRVYIPEHKPAEIFDTPTITQFQNKTRAEIKIQDGCNRFCSYCIIPKSRGRIRSKPLGLISLETEALAKNGYKEIVLVGINLSAYGQDSGNTLSEAVEAAAAVQGIERVRLGSLEFDQIDDAQLERLAKCKKFCPQFHLSLQSGSDKILKAMNRHYTTAEYSGFVEKLRRQFKNPSITTDIIVGFPGESEADFQETLRYAEQLQLARSHIFPYSRREGTKAATMTGQITAAVKQERCRRLIKATAASENAFLASQVGKTVRVLFEFCKDGFYEGYSENYTRVKVYSPNNLCGQIHPVKITQAEHDFCYADLCNQN
ncbi:MAG: tRNA (N(6)-L-threonylcarbamoyladenosine(37)-C(2))-methylthiotransferase MtaB [Clostridia bacterium]|nr:tRNA (N(6)-L-threonylcarbamoyladenosine(37)-C(2))-methylthiotransferase MtaB [Clostridia bacterium]MBQ7289262.1 tRNA (N(6)-L-threonylcarbamoyladenosine(37)-C(2))-methylthiotransferase MtaB [Clostridia bacterium]